MKRLLSILAVTLVSLSAHADIESLNAIVDKNPVMLDEAITLTVIANGDAEREAFDSSVLLKDFVVGRTSVSSSTQIINFDAKKTVTWTTTLFPREVGKFTIPAFNIEGISSAPIAIEVVPVPNGRDQTARDYYITTQTDASDYYLQQQIRYTVKLHLAASIERGSLQAPTLFNATVRQLGEDKQYSDIINGKRYQIIERTFALIPQQSGDLTIKGPVFSGEVLAPNTNMRFGMFNRTQSISRRGPDIDVTIQPVPEGIDYHWLPSEFVQLNEEWQSDTFTVGEPVTRTLTLTAAGLVEEQIPPLEQSYPPGFKTYPDQANTATVDREQTLVAQRVESIAVIPTKPGLFVLPEISVPWFNVRTGETELARIPPRQINVVAAQENIATQTSPSVPVVAPPPSESTATSNETTRYWPSYSNWILLVLWLLTVIGWSATVRYYRKHPSDTITLAQQQPFPLKESHQFAALNKAINKGNAGDIKKQLDAWLKDGLSVPFSATSRYVDFEQTRKLSQHIDELYASQYGSENASWDKTGLVKTIQTIRNEWKQSKSKNKNKLPSLYP